MALSLQLGKSLNKIMVQKSIASRSRQGLFMIFIVIMVAIGVSCVGSENRQIILTVASSKVLKQHLGSSINLVNSSGFFITLSMYYGKDGIIDGKSGKNDNKGKSLKNSSSYMEKINPLTESSRDHINNESISDSRLSYSPDNAFFKPNEKAIPTMKATAPNRNISTPMTTGHSEILDNEKINESLTDGHVYHKISTQLEDSRVINASLPSSKTLSQVKNNLTINSLLHPGLKGIMLNDPFKLVNLTAMVSKSVPSMKKKETSENVVSDFNRKEENLCDSKLIKSLTTFQESGSSGVKNRQEYSNFTQALRRSFDSNISVVQALNVYENDQKSFDNQSEHHFSKLLKIITFNSSLSASCKAQLFPISNALDSRVITVYSTEAIGKLQILKDKIKSGKKITLVMNGGSSSAFVPNGTPSDRFYLQFVHNFLKSELNANVEVFDRAHGSRNSAHSAHLMTSFLPHQKIDILIWEFSINDGTRADNVRNAFILWLRNVASRSTSPPLVILVYLWKSPFSLDESGKVYCRTFEQHNMIGSEYDFVLGHINVAAYFDSLGWDFQDLKSAFIADAHHPNALTHHIIAKLLTHLVSKASDSLIPLRKHVPAEKTDLTWVCGNETTDKMMLESLFNETKGVAKASYTADFPRNADGTNPFMLVPQSNNSFHFMSFGKINDQRSDRQNGLIIPCCQSNSFVEFNLSSIEKPKAVMMSLRCNETRKEWLRIQKNGEILENKPKLIRPWNWKCLLGGYNMNIGELPSLDVDFWFPESKLTRIGFCDSKCDPMQPIPLVYLTVF
jgi:hypothetical protein